MFIRTLAGSYMYRSAARLPWVYQQTALRIPVPIQEQRLKFYSWDGEFNV